MTEITDATCCTVLVTMFPSIVLLALPHETNIGRTLPEPVSQRMHPKTKARYERVLCAHFTNAIVKNKS
jgi:hypothetical protein